MAATTALLIGAQPCLSQQVTPADSQAGTPGSSHKNRFKAPEPKETETEGSSSKWLIIGGTAALGIGAIALGAGGSSGGGSDSSAVAEPETTSSNESSSSSDTQSSSGPTTSTASTATETDTEYVGPNVAGSDWHGTLIIENDGFEGSQDVTASIVQSGSDITLRTSSSLAYGRLFHGKIRDNGYITLKDAQTQKIWTSFEGFATRSYIKMYDYVNANTAFDRLVITR